MSKHILEIFSKFEPSFESRAILQSSEDNYVKFDRERRIVEIEIAFPSVISKKSLYKIEDELRAAYGLNYAKLLPKYPPD